MNCLYSIIIIAHMVNYLKFTLHSNTSLEWNFFQLSHKEQLTLNIQLTNPKGQIASQVQRDNKWS